MLYQQKQFAPGDEVARIQGIGGSDAYAAANIMTQAMEKWATSQYELYLIKAGVQNGQDADDSEEVEIDLSEEKEGYSATIGIDLRVVASEARKFSLTMQRSANDKIMDIATAIGEMIQVEKYGLSFYYGGKCLDL